MWTRIVILVLLCALSKQDTCKNPSSRSVKISITSKRNQTGHQVTQTRVIRDIPSSSTDAMIFPHLDIEQGITECSEKKSHHLSVITSAVPEIPPSYELFPKMGRYKLHTTSQTWAQAQSTCQQEGAHLAIVNSEMEAHVLNDILSRNSKTTGDVKAFVGISDIVTEGKFVTVLGDPLSSTGYVKWDASEPNNMNANATNPGQDCVAFHRFTRGFDDYNCYNKLYFICEMEL